MSETTYDTPKQIGENPQGIYRRWMAELSIADKQEKDWRKQSNDIIDKYRGKNGRKNSFNILWANTETLAPAVYNSSPKPDVRRRYRDADPVGKVVSEVLSRDLEFCIDSDVFDHSIRMDVIDMLLCGRGLSRVRYIPSLVQVGTPIPDENAEEPSHEKFEGDQEELAWECTTLEHVQWDDFRHGPGRTWEEVTWQAFRHRMTREELVQKFGEEIGSQVELNEAADDDLKQKDGQLKELFNTAEVWEIWDKDKRQVLFVSQGYRLAPIYTAEDPLELEKFFPTVRPLYAIFDASTLLPTTLYSQYKQQAEELDRVSTRINKIVDALKLRGIYDSNVQEMQDLMRADDNDLIPTQNAGAWADRQGGLAGSIYILPIADAANVLVQLNAQREACKQVIYEISGVSDVLRAATDPGETLGAQQLKAQYGGQRLQNMQREVQRYIRDLVRLMGEIISEKFQPDTIFGMANMTIPTQQQVQIQMMQFQQQAQRMQAAGQQPPPPPQMPITQEQVISVMRDDLQRTYKIDIETDSTVAATINDDMQSLNSLLTGLTQFMNGVAPIVQAGALPIDAVKEVVMSICRRAKLGNAVEDAFDKMKAPNPPADPNQGKTAEIQAQVQGDIQKENIRAQADIQIENNKIASEERLAQFEMQLKGQLETQNAAMDAKLEVILAMIKAQSAVEVAEVNKSAVLDNTQISQAVNASQAMNGSMQ